MNKKKNAAVLAAVLYAACLFTGCAAADVQVFHETGAPETVVTEATVPETTVAATEITQPVTEPTPETTEPVTETPAPGPYDTIPLLFQNYSVVPFGQHNVSTSGCGITCVAMLASYYYEFDYTPDDMARWFRISSETGVCMDYAIEQLELPLESRHYGDAIFENMWDALDQGKHILALMMQDSLFTTTGHYILITGVTEDGKYLVNDPNARNYEKERLTEGFANGFTKEEISRGLSGIYIFSAKEDFPCDRENPPIFGEKS